MAPKYECPECGRRFAVWGAEKLNFHCPQDEHCPPDAIGKEINLAPVGAAETKAAKPSLKRASKKKAAPVVAPPPEESEAEEIADEPLGDGDDEEVVEEDEEEDLVLGTDSKKVVPPSDDVVADGDEEDDEEDSDDVPEDLDFEGGDEPAVGGDDLEEEAL